MEFPFAKANASKTCVLSKNEAIVQLRIIAFDNIFKTTPITGKCYKMQKFGIRNLLSRSEPGKEDFLSGLLIWYWGCGITSLFKTRHIFRSGRIYNQIYPPDCSNTFNTERYFRFTHVVEEQNQKRVENNLAVWYNKSNQIRLTLQCPYVNLNVLLILSRLSAWGNCLWRISQ